MSTRLLRLPIPGPAFGAYPERAVSTGEATPARGASGGWARRDTSRSRFVAQVRQHADAAPAFGSGDFAAQLHALRAALGQGGLSEPLLARAFGLLARATQATLGVTPFDTQLIAARILLGERLAEMATGEGKTLAAMLAAATAALAGVPVHVVTANAYLAARDAERLAPVYAALGLTVRALVAGDDEAARRSAYAGDIVYCTAKDLIFDYLRDRTRAGISANTPAETGAEPLMRGLCMALVDEADSVLIDEARSPFILAREVHDDAAQAQCREALAIARRLAPGEHFELDPALRRASLTALGQQRCLADDAAGRADPVWVHRRQRRELVEAALAALHLYQADVHYLVRNGQVEIIDATTGRIAEGRRWAGGMHQLIELKEGCAPSATQRTTAQLTYQRFFPRYWRLAGMSGTLVEARHELRAVYGLAVERVGLRLPSRRSHAPACLYAGSAARWRAVLERITAAHAAGRPVLIGTESLVDSEHLCARLQQLGLPHQRLDARQDQHEAECIARAGEAGCITVSTNLAGRGTDIVLGSGVAERGGLLVIACQQNASARIDRQLHGRAGRAGDPGSVVTLLALDHGLLAQRVPRALARVLARTAPADGPLPGWLGHTLLRALHGAEERRGRAQRSHLARTDHELRRGLGFGARIE